MRWEGALSLVQSSKSFRYEFNTEHVGRHNTRQREYPENLEQCKVSHPQQYLDELVHFLREANPFETILPLIGARTRLPREKSSVSGNTQMKEEPKRGTIMNPAY